MIIERYLGQIEGVFVEVGAFDGVTFSNTFGLVEKNWEGYYLEPDPTNYQKCLNNFKFNPKITVSNFAISSTERKAKLYRQGPLSTLSKTLHENYKQIIWTSGEPDRGFVEVACLTLEEYLEVHKIKRRFDLLVVDVEGFETEVFESFNLAYWIPEMIIVELADLHPDFPDLEKANIILRRKIESKGYSIIYKDHINTIFILNETLDKKISE
jgi:FkbM family methyltransferase